MIQVDVEAPEPPKRRRVRHNYVAIKEAAEQANKEGRGAARVDNVSNVTVLSRALHTRFPDRKFRVYTVGGKCYVKINEA